MEMSAPGGTVEADYDESEPFPLIGFSGFWLINED